MRVVKLLLALFITACSQINQSDKEPTVKENLKLDETIGLSRDVIDSIRFHKTLVKALEYAQSNLGKASFSFSFGSTPDDSSYSINTELVYGNIFDKARKHLLVRRHSPSVTRLNVYLEINQKLTQQISRIYESMTYEGDTIMDVNGDNILDYVVKWYPSAGCCLANMRNVYLYLPSKKAFSKDFRFINPNFYPQEKTVRGILYGHPGETALYKYKWNSFEIDTIEFVYPKKEDSLNRTYLRTNTMASVYNSKKGSKLKSVPPEYKALENYNWFTGEIKNASR